MLIKNDYTLHPPTEMLKRLRAENAVVHEYQARIILFSINVKYINSISLWKG